MTNEELNYFLDKIGRDEAGHQVIQANAKIAVAALEELQKVFNATMNSIEITPKYKEVNQWGETEEEYQKWKLNAAMESLKCARTPAAKLVMLYFWNRLDHKFNEDAQELNFRVTEVAQDLGITSKGIRDILPALETDGFIRRKSGWNWHFIGEPVMRRMENEISKHLGGE